MLLLFLSGSSTYIICGFCGGAGPGKMCLRELQLAWLLCPECCMPYRAVLYAVSRSAHSALSGRPCIGSSSVRNHSAVLQPPLAACSRQQARTEAQLHCQCSLSSSCWQHKYLMLCRC
jgi:hypothetical protein